MGTDNVVFLEILEWFDSTGTEMVCRIPEKGSGEIKWGARLIVRESQAAVFFYNGKAYDAFGPGNHHLTTANIPILNKVLSIPWKAMSPLRTEVYFVNLKLFINLKWGTRDPVAFRDKELGLIRLRSFGIFNIRIVQPVLFVNYLLGTQHLLTTADIEEFLNRVIVSRFNDYMGEHLDTIFNLPSRYEEISEGLKNRLAGDFGKIGLQLEDLYINSITPPEEVQKAIDDKSRLEVFDNMNKLMQLKAASAIEKASENQGEAGAGVGMGMGLMMPAMFAQYTQQEDSKIPSDTSICPDCGNRIPSNARFCLHCGHQIVVFRQCQQCGKNLTANARFCSKCGAKVEVSHQPKSIRCSHCKHLNLTNSIFCNQCGERL